MRPGRLRAWLTALLLLVAVWPAAASIPGLPSLVLPAPADEVRAEPAWRERLLHLFVDGTLRDERAVEGRLAKWTGPIELSLRGAAGPYLAFVEALAAELSGLTGLAIEVALHPPRAGTMDVYIASDPAYWPRGLRPADATVTVFACAAAPSVRSGVIRGATIRINAGVLPPGVVRACLLEEIVQSLGLFGEVREPADTILSDQVGYEGLGIVDRLLLRTLYDPRLPPGAGRAAVRPLAAAILDEQLSRLVCHEDEVPRRCDLP